MEGCWCGYLSGARCRLAYDQLPLPLTVSCFSEIQIGFTSLVPAHPGSPGQRPLNGCVCIRACDTAVNTRILLPERWCKDCTFFSLNQNTEQKHMQLYGLPFPHESSVELRKDKSRPLAGVNALSCLQY